MLNAELAENLSYMLPTSLSISSIGSWASFAKFSSASEYDFHFSSSALYFAASAS